jgi:phosphoglucomutase
MMAENSNHDRHGIVTRSAGLMNANHCLDGSGHVMNVEL